MTPLGSMPRMIPPPRHRERGSSALEFALVFPLLITLLLGIVDFSRLQSQRMSLSSAAYEGARASAVVPGTDAARNAAAVALGISATDFAERFDYLPVTNENCQTKSTAAVPQETVMTITSRTDFKWFMPLFLLRPPTIKVKGTGRWPCLN